MNYTPTGNPGAQTRGTSALIRNEFALVQSAVNSKLDSTAPSLIDGTANTPPVGDSSTKIANTAFVAATAFSPALPAQAGNGGKFVTTDGSAASWASLPVTIGSGGQTTTGNVTLTSTSQSAITVTPATPGLYVTLPDAATCAKGTANYCIYNAGDYDYGVKDSAGTQLGWVRARTGAMIGLSDSSTAAGVWACYGLEKTGITASFANVSLSGVVANTPTRIALDSSRTCFVFGGTNCYAIVYDASTQIWGSATLIRASIGSSRITAVLSATNQVLVCTCDSAGSAFQAVTLTTSGTSITVNTAVTTGALAGGGCSFAPMIAVPAQSAFAVHYLTAAGNYVRALTVSGTVPTIGSELVSQSTNLYLGPLFVQGSVVRAIGSDGTSVYCKPFTISGSTCTAGTAASTPCDSNFRVLQNGNGNLVMQLLASANLTAAIFKLTGTVEAVSTVAIGGSTYSTLSTVTDMAAVTASKMLSVAYTTSSVIHINIITDTAGVASVGTDLTPAIGGLSALTGVSCLASSSANARVIFVDSSRGYFQLNLDVSTSSSALTSVQVVPASLSGGVGLQTPFPIASAANAQSGTRNVGQLFAGTSAFVLGGSGAFSSDLRFTPNSINKVGTLMVNGTTQSGLAYGVSGAASNESWVAMPIGYAGTIGYTIQRIEAAA